MTKKKFLKSIELVGFKSFADKTLLPFAEGMTGIVGPNGCGKSNISDAFRWVLGEQSAKSMRGGKMHDVIFAGTTKRRSLNYAEVTITVDNSEQLLPIGFEEIAVTRRVHRSGESEYFLNRKHCRLKDVQDLFLESGVGKNSFAIFEQGKIDQIISYTPNDRRRIFEEAAGILRFLVEKERAMRKLGQVDQNMSRVLDIHQEVERQISILEDQVTKAKAYKSNKEEFESLDKGLIVTRWERLTNRFGNIQDKESKDKTLLEEQNAILEKLHEDLLVKREALLTEEQAYKEQHEKLYSCRSEQAVKHKEKQSCQERLRELEKKEEQWNQEIEGITAKQASFQTEKEHLTKQYEEAAKALSTLEAAACEKWEEVREQEGQLQKLRQQQGNCQHEMLKLVQKEKRIESDYKQTEIHLDHHQNKQTRLTQSHETLIKQFEELTILEQEKEKELHAFSTQIDEQKGKLATIKGELETLEERIDDLNEKKKKTHRERTEAQARQNVLMQLREEMEGFSSGTKTILHEATQEESSLYQKVKGLYEWISPEEGTEALLRPYTQTLVVETWEDFEALSSYAKQEELTDFSVICLEHISEKELSTHFFQKMTKTDDVLSGLKWLETHPGGKAWAKDGGYIDSNGVIFYTSKGENNVFLREAEIKELKKELKKLEKEENKLEGELEEAKSKQQVLSQECTDLDRTVRKEEMRLVEVNFALQKAKNDRTKLTEEKTSIEEEVTLIKQTIIEFQEKLKNYNVEHAEAKKEAEHFSKEMENRTEALEEQAQLLEEKQKQHKEKEGAHQHTLAEERKLQHALDLLEMQHIESQQQIERLKQELEAALETKTELQTRVQEDDETLNQLQEGLLTLVDSVGEKEKAVTACKEELKQYDQQQEQVRKVIKEFEQKLYQFGLDRTQVESQQETLQTDLVERYHVPIEELKETVSTLECTIEQAERRLRTLRNAIESIGDVNMTAVEEFDKATERFNFLQAQLDDLEKSKEELVEIITKLDEESRTVFQETFEQIRLNFQKNFGILFKGGEADLRFTEAEDILQAGIEIVAKPPGKQMRSIQQLSGGEKCLTALALLFAIFEVKPAPFCILDEVDAPLDDSNIERFVNVVKQFTDSCQFIVITHSKRTMAICDRLFGVSMEERGVTKMLSVDFSREETPEPVLV